jgi:hypothetical protein
MPAEAYLPELPHATGKSQGKRRIFEGWGGGSTSPSPSLLRGTRCRSVRLAEIGKIRAHQPHIGRHPIGEGRVRG